jgi:deoxyribonuclease V
MREKSAPVYVSIGHMMDLETAVEIVLSMGAGFREPETTRRAHALVNRLRRGPSVQNPPSPTSHQ